MSQREPRHLLQVGQPDLGRAQLAARSKAWLKIGGHPSVKEIAHAEPEFGFGLGRRFEVFLRLDLAIPLTYWRWLRVPWPICDREAAALVRQSIGLHSPPENAMFRVWNVDGILIQCAPHIE